MYFECGSIHCATQSIYLARHGHLCASAAELELAKKREDEDNEPGPRGGSVVDLSENGDGSPRNGFVHQ